MRTVKCLTVAAVLMLTLAGLSGCLVAAVGGAAAGAGGAVWYQGGLTTSLPAPLPKVREASISTLEGLTKSVTEENESYSETVRSTSLENRDIKITLKAKSVDVTEITVRIGFWGDKVRSEQVLDEIRKKLNLPKG